jgi:PPK2 family polyphosphate:nucleotide phosphotransferase
VKEFKVKPNSKVKLSEWDPNDTGDFKGGKQEGLEEIAGLLKKLQGLQELLYAEHKHRVLIVLQGMDTAGKDGAVRHVFDGVNPQGVRVVAFKQPSAEELDHDYLWRIHREMPASGGMVIFNRSHYEDVLVTRVHNLVPPEVWKRRFDEINQFEAMLTDNGVTILKFYLNIDQDEQRQRLQARLDDPTKHWKFRLGDLAERKLWPAYMEAYQDMLGRTSTEQAPWYVVPSNRKWLRDLVISTTLVETLKGFKMKYPESGEDLAGLVVK